MVSSFICSLNILVESCELRPWYMLKTTGFILKFLFKVKLLLRVMIDDFYV